MRFRIQRIFFVSVLEVFFNNIKSVFFGVQELVFSLYFVVSLIIVFTGVRVDDRELEDLLANMMMRSTPQ